MVTNNKMEDNPMIQGPLNSNSVFDFSGTATPPPTTTNVGVLQSRIREVSENKEVDSVLDYQARAGGVINEFKNQFNEQLDYISDDNDFSLNQISGYQGKLAKLRNREATLLNDVYKTGLGIVSAREEKKRIKEERKYQEKLLKDSRKWDLKLTAMKYGIKTSGSRKKLLKRISKYIAKQNIKKTEIGVNGMGAGTDGTGLPPFIVDQKDEIRDNTTGNISDDACLSGDGMCQEDSYWNSHPYLQNGILSKWVN